MIESTPPQYISGFTEGEGCFSLYYRKDTRYNRPGRPTYFQWKVTFAITVKAADAPLLRMIRDTLGCGSVSLGKKNPHATYNVYDLSDLKGKIVPFFQENQLYGEKKKDFILWSRAVVILHSHKQKRKVRGAGRGQGFRTNEWTEGELNELRILHRNMRAVKGQNYAKHLKPIPQSFGEDDQDKPTVTQSLFK